jgi:hypothetical protein
MVKIDSNKKLLEELYETGQENAALIPMVENWCVHLNISCFSGGMFAQASNLVNEVSLSCPHASHPVSWHSISYVAEEFIKQNCISCAFHNARLEPNYGQEVLATIERKKQEEMSKEAGNEATAQKVRDEVENLIREGKKNANQTQLSILNLVSNLTLDLQRAEAARKLSAAAKLDPAFFSDAAIEVLFLHFEDGMAGEHCIRAVKTLMISRLVLTQKAFDIATLQIGQSPHFDELAGILLLFIDAGNAKDHIGVIENLIDRLWYRRFVGEAAKPKRNFQQSEAFLEKLGTDAPELLKSILIAQLSIDEKNKRLNINLLLQRLMEKLPGLVSELTLPLIKSLELTDDKYGQSADQTTLNTLCKLVKVFPESTIATLEAEIPKLSLDCQKAVVKLNIELLSDRVFTDHNPSISEKLTNDVTSMMLNKGISEQIRDEASKQLSYFVKDRPEFFSSKFDGFLGYLSEIAESERMFDYYNNEIKTKQPHEYATFNFLIGKNFIEIDNEKQGLIRRYREVKKILGSLCKANPTLNLPRVYSLIPKLDSKKDEKYKLELLSIITDYANDPITIAGFMPQFYLHLLDPDSLDIRFKALTYFAKLVASYPMTITTPLWDLLDVFLADTDVIVSGAALIILGAVAEHTPERITLEHLNIHKNALFHPRVYIHTSAIGIAEDLYPLMTSKQREDTLITLLRLAEVYSSEEDKTHLFTIVDQIVAFGADRPNMIHKVVEKFLFPLTDINEYYEAKERIEKLERLVGQFPSIEQFWLKSAIGYLIRFPHDGGSQDDRLELFFKMHHLKEESIIGQLAEFSKLVSLPRTAIQAHLDIAHVLDILGYFGLYEAINEITAGLVAQYPDVTANKPLLSSIKFWHQIGQSETQADVEQRLIHLKEAKNVYN